MTVTGFAKDPLQRGAFADRLARVVVQLAKARVIPGGRVIAVDAPWGSGKSWIAEKLPEHLKAHKGIGNCAYVNAFQFDYHQDPFAVLVSAVCESAEGQTEAKRNLKDAAKEVMKVAAPFALNLATGAARILVGIEPGSLANVLTDATEATGAKALDDALDSLEKTRQSSKAFREKLGALAAHAQGPLVVIIDELDRCRPTFALELLERMKHLFEVEGVVFVLFLHSEALHAIIRQTYGADVVPHEYLRKFISVTMTLPLSVNAGAQPKYQDEVNYFDAFIRTQCAPSTDAAGLHSWIAEFAPLFDATLRQVQSALMLAELYQGEVYRMGELAAYALLLQVCNPDQRDAMIAGNAEAFATEFARVQRFPKDRGGLGGLSLEFQRLATGSAQIGHLQSEAYHLMKLMSRLDLTYLTFA